MNDTINLLRRHRSIRKFKPDPVSLEQLRAILRSAQAASTSSNVQAYSVIGITGTEKRKELAGLDGIVYIGGIRNRSYEVSELLKLPELVYPVFGMCIGYPDQDPLVRPRLETDAIYHENEYDQEKHRQTIDRYDETIRQYYLERTKGKKYTTWILEMADKFKKPARLHMKSFLKSKGFMLE
jgi:hypothetical protein